MTAGDPDVPVASIVIDLIEPDAMELWRTVAKVSEALGSERRWCLVGGLMVALFAIEAQQSQRATTDIDVLADARSRPSATEWASRQLEALAEPSPRSAVSSMSAAFASTSAARSSTPSRRTDSDQPGRQRRGTSRRSRSPAGRRHCSERRSSRSSSMRTRSPSAARRSSLRSCSKPARWASTRGPTTNATISRVPSACSRIRGLLEPRSPNKEIGGVSDRGPTRD